MSKRKCKRDEVGVEKCECQGCRAMMDLMNAPFTFSINCCKGIVAKDACECCRCRRERGQEVNDDTEALAKKISDEAKAKFDASTQKFLEKMRKENVPEDKWVDRFIEG
jgi:hypothetical protein